MPTSPAQKRYKIYTIILLLAILTTLYVTRSSTATRDSEFYQRTVAALDERTRVEQQGRLLTPVDEASRAEGPGGKKPPQANAQRPLGDEGGAGQKSVAGRKMMNSDSGEQKGLAEEEAEGYPKVGNVVETQKEDETDEEHMVEQHINDILKKSAVIIFSKTYCPFSKKAKSILVDKYKIVPAPFVVELDEEPLGQQIQQTLAKMTGRKTVPNILVNGKSIGGGDEIAELHNNNELVNTLTSMAGKRISEAALRS